MARVSGIIAAGLSASERPRGTSTPDSDAAAALDAVTARQQRISATQGNRGTGPDLFTTGAAAAGLGLVFGPVGALIGGAVAGALTKRRNEGLAAYALQSAQSTEAAMQRARSALETAAEQASPEQQADVELALAQLETLEAQSLSPDASTRAQAVIAAGQLAGTLDSELEESAARIRQARLDRQQQLGEQFDDFDNLAGDLRTESVRFERSRESFRQALAYLENPDRVTDTGLVYAVVNALDPGAIVTEGDVQSVKAGGSITESLAGQLNSILFGESEVSDTQRQQLVRLIALNYREQRTAQIQRNERYQAIGEARGLLPEYQQQLRVQIDPDEAGVIARLTRPVQNGPSVVPEDERPASVREVPENNRLARTIGAASTALDLVRGAARRQAEGQTLVEGSDGLLYIQGQDGELLEYDGPLQRESFEERLRRGDPSVGRIRRRNE